MHNAAAILLGPGGGGGPRVLVNARGNDGLSVFFCGGGNGPCVGEGARRRDFGARGCEVEAGGVDVAEAAGQFRQGKLQFEGGVDDLWVFGDCRGSFLAIGAKNCARVDCVNLEQRLFRFLSFGAWGEVG